MVYRLITAAGEVCVRSERDSLKRITSAVLVFIQLLDNITDRPRERDEILYLLSFKPGYDDY